MKESAKQKRKMAKVMSEFKDKKLHSGSKAGPVVKSPKQAIAIGMSEAGMSKKDGKQMAKNVAKRFEGKKHKSAMY